MKDYVQELPEEVAQDEKTRKEYESRKSVNLAIMNNEKLNRGHRLSIKDLAAKLKVPISVVYDQRNRLRRIGLIANPKHLTSSTGSKLVDTKGQIPTGGPIQPGTQTSETGQDRRTEFDAAELLRRVNAGQYATEHDRRSVLSLIIANGADPYKITAIKALEDMDAARDKGIGPPAPMAPAEQVARLMPLLQAVGKDTAQLAMEAAFGQAPEAQEEHGEVGASGSGVG